MPGLSRQVGTLSRKLEIKDSSFVDLAFRRALPPVQMEDAPGNGTPDPGPLEFRGAMEPLKDTKKFIIIFHADADAAVFHIETFAPLF